MCDCQSWKVVNEIKGKFTSSSLVIQLSILLIKPFAFCHGSCRLASANSSSAVLYILFRTLRFPFVVLSIHPARLSHTVLIKQYLVRAVIQIAEMIVSLSIAFFARHTLGEFPCCSLWNWARELLAHRVGVGENFLQYGKLQYWRVPYNAGKVWF